MLGVFVFALLGSFTLANAQEEKKGRAGRGDPLTAALEKAGLSDEQKEKVKTINEDYRKASAAAREAKDREASRKAGTERTEKILAVLDDKQQEIVKKHLEENRSTRGEKGDRKKRPE